VVNKSSEAAVYASFTQSQIIARRSKLFTDGESVATETLCPEKQQLFKTTTLSANSSLPCK
jgi:hypothetical protein